MPGRHIAEFVGGPRITGDIPNLPQGAVFAAQPPQRESLDAGGLGDPHMIQGRHPVKKPHVVTKVSLVEITEMGIQGIVIEGDVFVRITRLEPCLLHAHRLIFHFRR